MFRPPEELHDNQDEPEMTHLKALIVDDNLVHQDLVRLMLEAQGHRTHAAEDREGALEALRHADFDLVVIGMQMAAWEGLRAARDIRALPGPAATVAIVALTANPSAMLAASYLAGGMDEVVAKPVHVGRLMDAIARAIAVRPTVGVEPARPEPAWAMVA